MALCYSSKLGIGTIIWVLVAPTAPSLSSCNKRYKGILRGVRICVFGVISVQMSSSVDKSSNVKDTHVTEAPDNEQGSPKVFSPEQVGNGRRNEETDEEIDVLTRQASFPTENIWSTKGACVGRAKLPFLSTHYLEGFDGIQARCSLLFRRFSIEPSTIIIGTA
jgi:hypothetical protein